MSWLCSSRFLDGGLGEGWKKGELAHNGRWMLGVIVFLASGRLQDLRSPPRQAVDIPVPSVGCALRCNIAKYDVSFQGCVGGGWGMPRGPCQGSRVATLDCRGAGLAIDVKAR